MFKHTGVKPYISWLNLHLDTFGTWISLGSFAALAGRLIEALQVIKLFGLKLTQVVNMLQFFGLALNRLVSGNLTNSHGKFMKMTHRNRGLSN